MITVLEAGSLTSIQDHGRYGYQAYGMPVSGAMDGYALRLANLLTGNKETAAVIEMTEHGGSFRFDKEQVAAVAGGDMVGQLNGEPIENWSAFLIPKGSELTFAKARTGCRTYLALRGGINVLPVLHSRATCIWARIGGFEGRALKKGDVLYVGQDVAIKPRGLGKVPKAYLPHYGQSVKLHVLLGLQHYEFLEDSLEDFFSSSYKVSTKADRISYTFEGNKLFAQRSVDMVSDAVNQGAVQILPSGLPLIAMADHPTTRGFIKLGSVIKVDLDKIAQLRSGNTVEFIRVSEAEAIQALEERQEIYQKIASNLR